MNSIELLLNVINKRTKKCFNPDTIVVMLQCSPDIGNQQRLMADYKTKHYRFCVIETFTENLTNKM